MFAADTAAPADSQIMESVLNWDESEARRKCCQQVEQAVDLLMRSQCLQETADVVLEEDDERDGTHLDQLVEDGAEQAHFQHLRHEQPQQDEDEHAGEYLHRTGLFHEFVGIVEQECDREYVDNVFDFDREHHNGLTGVGR